VFALVKNFGVVTPLCSLLDVQDGNILMVVLDALEALFKCDEKSSGLLLVPALVDEADGLERLEALQEHENHAVYTKAVHLIEAYFGAEDDDEETGPENIAPQGSTAAFSFGLPAGGGSKMPCPPAFGSGGALVPAMPLAPTGGFNFSFNQGL